MQRLSLEPLCCQNLAKQSQCTLQVCCSVGEGFLCISLISEATNYREVFVQGKDTEKVISLHMNSRQ